MADDLRLFLSDRTIRSRRTTTFERLWRWRRRNPALSAITAALVIAVALGLAGVTWKWRDAERARRSERAARNDADRRAEQIRLGQEQLKAASGLVDAGVHFSAAGGWDDAESAYSQAIALRPDFAPGWEKRGELYFRLGLFDLAAADFQRAFELNEPVFHSQWLRLALLRLHAGDAGGYRVVSDRMAERFFGTSNATAATDLIRVRVLSGGGWGDAARWVGLARRVVSAEPAERSGYVLGASLYRAGEYERAVERLGATGPSRAAPARLPVLGMAYHRLGRDEPARRAFASAVEARDRWLEQIVSAAGRNWVIDQGATGEWAAGQEDWLEFEAQLLEAAALLGLPAPGADARLKVHRGRAFAGLRHREQAEREYAEALRLGPGSPLVVEEARRVFGFCLLGEGRFAEAAAEFTRAMRHGADLNLWRYVAVAQCAAGDVQAYRRTCAEMFDRFGRVDDPHVLFTVVLTCVLCPDALTDMGSLLTPGEKGGDWWIDSGRVLVGLYYRLGRYDNAVDALRRHSGVARPQAAALFFAAMAHHQLGHAEEARREFRRGVSAMTDGTGPETLRTMARGLDPRDWSEKISEHVLRKEAEALILKAPGRPE
jgi:tetratricopeptide (TPR) repeat protein